MLSTSAKRWFRFGIFLGALFEWECIYSCGILTIFTASVFLILLLLEAYRVHLLEDIWPLSVTAIRTGFFGLEAGYPCTRGQLKASKVLLIEDIWPLSVTAMRTGFFGLEAGFLCIRGQLEASFPALRTGFSGLEAGFLCIRGQLEASRVILLEDILYDLCLSLLWGQVSLN